MDALNPEYKNNSETKTSETDSRSRVPAPGSFLGFFRAAQQSAQAAANSTTPQQAQPIPAPASTNGFAEPAPAYRGKYERLSPLNFNTMPVDNAEDTRLDRNKLAIYDRAQLFFLLRLERFLRLRHHWLNALPRTDESWKTELVMRSIFSAMNDCEKHSVGEVAVKLIKDWGCC